MPSREPPKHTQILVVGGGPAGSYAAAALAREGFQVVLMEASKFPRYHVGESLIPSVRHYLRFIGAEEKVAQYGFAHKPGSAIKFNQFNREGYTDFVALGHDNSAWNVVRSEFDQLLLQHAASCGVQVFERTRVTSLSFAPPSPAFQGEDTLGRPVSATYVVDASVDSDSPSSPSSWSQYSSGEDDASTITFDYLIDATGRAGLMSTRYLRNRRINDSLKNIATWGYWRDTKMYAKGTARENAPWFEALTDESGWAWFIPLHNGLTSVGVVMSQKCHASRSRAMSEATPPPTPTVPSLPIDRQGSLVSRYLDALKSAPGVMDLIGDGVLTPVKSTSDWSYSASCYAGAGWRIIGDAGAFIDPFFSSGIHLAFTGGLSAATTVAASIRGQCTEAGAAEWHNRRVTTSYTRFLVVVLSAYKQFRAQSIDALADVGEANFDDAFGYLRPVIQGATEMGPQVSASELQRAFDFCVNLFSPTTPEEHKKVAALLAGKTSTVQGVLDVTKPLVDGKTLKEIMEDLNIESTAPSHVDGHDRRSSCDEDDGQDDSARTIKMVFDKVNARRVIHSDHSGIGGFEEEALGGLVARLVQGNLGLVRA
ncbi:FAD/NAD P-binding domain-containing protein [Gloeophyllum trabeum ATCC 11539]|uniref:FAD/NAD P-binding domain-containing protein n=1 Tax=Gloeophyllum trabeum (strain ATCC 11539 / FP-39264 / Madison 617) TaxID=670483 RepID=S7RIC9_GLOTA|nr:FAD/NAD P-binding domain-containing protein [Gloeophyllum trabeum ATCC 11539]EPQ54055.1 FAD/NAD P-binding domain-containing protein [Gloeophyllum trabeum ATCC 11539]